MNDILILDGGFGTMAQSAGLLPGEDPVEWNLTRPDDVASIHRAYAAAGADIVLANTFGANRLKYRGKSPLSDIVSSAVKLAKMSGAKAALDIGPTGRLLKSAGDLDFSEAFDAFSELVRMGVVAGADLVFVETMTDARELKAAVLAAKENSSLPVYATVSLDESGRLLTGADIDCVRILLESLDVDAYGFNCGLGPDLMLPFVERLAKNATRPVIVKPNAGMPRIVDGKTVFSVDPDRFARLLAPLVAAGASIAGGCCGSTPAHIKALKDSLSSFRRVSPARAKEKSHLPRVAVSSGSKALTLSPGDGTIIGERINPTGKKALKEAYRRGDTAYVLREAVKQTLDGAAILDVNCGVPGIDEAQVLESTIEAVQSVVACPIEIDTADPAALERALKTVNGKALVNSVNGKRESMDAVFPLVKRYGGSVIGLCLDENGIPGTADGRVAVARRILAEGGKYGLSKNDFLFDALTLAVSADPSAALVTLETVEKLTRDLGVNTVLGVSNVSFALPERPRLNNAMYTLAKRAGLSAAIANPSLVRECDDEAAFDVLLGRDKGCLKWIELSSKSIPPAELAAEEGDLLAGLRRCVGSGLAEDSFKSAGALLSSGAAAIEVIENGIVPALEKIGTAFEKGDAFLPQLLMAADAAGAAFSAVRESLAKISGKRSSRASRPIVIATVKGDIHDIGKNIVRALLENYGFDVIDLGRDVPPETIVGRARASGAFMIGLSALMTTTVGAMAETIRLAKEAALDAKICVGGAVVTQEYADSIGADFYAKDAMRTVRIAESLLAAD